MYIPAPVDLSKTATYNIGIIEDCGVIAMTCCFLGHKDTPSTIATELENVLTDLIVNHGVDSFLMGHQGAFDYMALGAVRKLKERYPHVTYNVALAYMPGKKEEGSAWAPEESVYPEGLEAIHPRYAISWRNKWMVDESDVVVAYVKHSWGGAAKYVEYASRKKKTIINIADR